MSVPGEPWGRVGDILGWIGIPLMVIWGVVSTMFVVVVFVGILTIIINLLIRWLL